MSAAEIRAPRRELRFPDDVPLMIEHLEKGWSVGGGDAVLILKGLLQMSMSDARQFAELSARVDTLEELCRSMVASVDALEGRIFGIDVHDEVLGPVSDPAARAGLRAMLKERRSELGLGVVVERKLPDGGPPIAESVDPAAAGEMAATELASDPGLKDKLAALQGGESTTPKPGSARK